MNQNQQDLFFDGEMEQDILNMHGFKDLLFPKLSLEVSNSSSNSSAISDQNSSCAAGSGSVGGKENEIPVGEDMFNAFINTDGVIQHENRGIKMIEGVKRSDYRKEIVDKRAVNFSGVNFQREAGEVDLQVQKMDMVCKKSTSNVDYYQYCEKFLNQRLVFGRSEPVLTKYVSPTKFLGVDASQLSYRLRVSDMPGRSRVETQIKIQLSVSPPPPQYLVHLPSDCIIKQKLYLNEDEHAIPSEVRKDLLFLEAFLICSTNNRLTNVCTRCVKREQRRAARRKSGLSDNLFWCNNQNRRAVVFNSKQVFLMKPEDCTATSKSFSLHTRIVCYCRHHKEPEGFKLLFILLNSRGDILGKDITSPIMIMDKESNKNRAGEALKENEPNLTSDLSILANKTNGECSTTTNSDFSGTENAKVYSGSNVYLSHGGNTMPSPTSIGEDSSEATSSKDYGSCQQLQNQQTCHIPMSRDSPAATHLFNGYKRKRAWPEPEFPISDLLSQNGLATSDCSFLEMLPSDQTTLTSYTPGKTAKDLEDQLQSSKLNRPHIHRIIPNQGSIKGGIEVTLLGSNFSPSDIIKFGENRALSIQCWSSSTVVTYLPPAPVAGKVLVTVFGQDYNEQEIMDTVAKSNSFFIYVDDTDRQLIELALQIVGLKMNGKLEDARNIAKRIVGTDRSSTSDTASRGVQSNGNTQYEYGNKIYYSDEMLLIKVIKLLNPGSNLSMCTEEGHTMLHLACLKGYYQLVVTLVEKGAHIDFKDSFGHTPLHFACIGGELNIIKLLVQCKAYLSAKANNGITALEFFRNNRSADKPHPYYYNRVISLLSERGLQEDSQPENRRMPDSSFYWNSPDNASIRSFNSELENIGTNAIYGDIESGLEPESSNYEEDGDDSLLYNDIALEQNDNINTSNLTSPFVSNFSSTPLDLKKIHAETEQLVPIDVVSSVCTTNIGSSISNYEGSLWNRMLNAFNENPPKYEDLYPASNTKLLEPKVHISTTTQGNTEISPNTSAPTISIDDSQSSSEDEEDALQALFNRFFQQRKNLRNDKMLLLFWIPLMIIILPCFLISRFGHDGNNVHNISKKLSDYVRIGIIKVMLGNKRMKTLFIESFNNFQTRRTVQDAVAT